MSTPIFIDSQQHVSEFKFKLKANRHNLDFGFGSNSRSLFLIAIPDSRHASDLYRSKGGHTPR
jgi:hypothetical protein